jgi:hypothetical protein
MRHQFGYAFGILMVVGLSVSAFGQDVLSSQGGRYVFGQLSEDDRSQYMLDTDTGRLWKLVNSEMHDIALDPVPYLFEVGAGWCLTPPDIQVEEAAMLMPLPQEEKREALVEKFIMTAIGLSVDAIIVDRLGSTYSKADSLLIRAHLTDSLRYEFDRIR